MDEIRSAVGWVLTGFFAIVALTNLIELISRIVDRRKEKKGRLNKLFPWTEPNMTIKILTILFPALWPVLIIRSGGNATVDLILLAASSVFVMFQWVVYKKQASSCETEISDFTKQIKNETRDRLLNGDVKMSDLECGERTRNNYIYAIRYARHLPHGYTELKIIETQLLNDIIDTNDEELVMLHFSYFGENGSGAFDVWKKENPDRLSGRKRIEKACE